MAYSHRKQSCPCSPQPDLTLREGEYLMRLPRTPTFALRRERTQGARARGCGLGPTPGSAEESPLPVPSRKCSSSEVTVPTSRHWVPSGEKYPSALEGQSALALAPRRRKDWGGLSSGGVVLTGFSWGLET